MAPLATVMLWCVATSFSFSFLVDANPDAKRLYDDLLSNYNKLVRPVVNTSDVLRVCIKLKLSQLIDVNLKNQIMTTNLWVEQSWYDYKLRWEPKEYGGVHMLHVPSDHIWRPDIVLYNNEPDKMASGSHFFESGDNFVNENLHDKLAKMKSELRWLQSQLDRERRLLNRQKKEGVQETPGTIFVNKAHLKDIEKKCEVELEKLNNYIAAVKQLKTSWIEMREMEESNFTAGTEDAISTNIDECRRQFRGDPSNQGDHLPSRISRMETARHLQVFVRN